MLTGNAGVLVRSLIVVGFAGKRALNTIARLVRKRPIRASGPGTICQSSQPLSQQTNLLFEAPAIAAQPEVNTQTHTFTEFQRPVVRVGDEPTDVFTFHHLCALSNLTRTVAVWVIETASSEP